MFLLFCNNNLIHLYLSMCIFNAQTIKKNWLYYCSLSYPGIVCYCFMFIMVCQGTTDVNELYMVPFK